jgi:hypothetical protein
MEEDRYFDNWDLDTVVRLGCRRRLSPPRQQPDNPFAAFLLPPPPQPQWHLEKMAVPAAPAPEPAKEAEVDSEWRFPDLFAGGGQDGDELLMALLAAQPPLPQPTLPTPPPPPPPPPTQQQQQQPPVVATVDVPPPQMRAVSASAPARAQPSGRPVPGGVPRSKRRYASLSASPFSPTPYGNGS